MTDRPKQDLEQLRKTVAQNAARAAYKQQTKIGTTIDLKG